MNPIITDEAKLRIVCEPVTSAYEASEIILKLEEALLWSERHGSPGAGLAAPQIGIPKSIAIIRFDNVKIDLANAKIVENYDLIEFKGEGCLSFPNRFETTKRYREIVVAGNMTKPHKFIATDFVAIVVQHELNHLDGILLPDVMVK